MSTPLPVAPTAPSVGHSPSVRPASTLGDVRHGNMRLGNMRLGNKSIKCEVVVVGTGAGGAVAGAELARQGKRVIFLEAGGALHRKHFQRRSMLWAVRNLYQAKGVQLAKGSPPLLIPSGRAVGGSTVINSGIAFRPPAERLEEYARITSDEGWGPIAMAPFVDEIWRRVGVMPTHAGIGRRNNEVFRDGLSRLGLPHGWMDRNAPGCVGCGVCHMGCPSGGKASVDRSILPEAINNGAEIFTFAEVQSLIIEGGRAVGVVAEVKDPDSSKTLGTLTVRADRVLLAGSALRTPLLLSGSGLGGDEVGKHLAIHSSVAAFAEFEDEIQMWNGVPQGYFGKDPAQPKITYEVANIGPAEIHALLGGPGAEGAARALRYKHLALGGAMLRDDAVGFVRGDVSSPELEYQVSSSDVKVMKKALAGLVKIYFAAGAKSVAPFVNPTTFYTSEDKALLAIDAVQEASDFSRIHGSHPHGTCRMGPERGPQAGVCQSNGQVWGTPELFVVDGSLFPTTLGVNPQISIMAFALAVARRMAS